MNIGAFMDPLSKDEYVNAISNAKAALEDDVTLYDYDPSLDDDDDEDFDDYDEELEELD
jgi:uncharacterized protein YpiB (UPF0302 family)